MANLLGVLFIVLGLIAIAEPLVAGLAMAVLAGWLLLFGGIAHAVAAFRGEGVGHVIWQVVLAAVYAIGGFYFLTHPLLGLGTLTLFLALVLLVEAGILLDVTVGVFVIGIIVDRIQRAFDSLDTRKLTALRE